MTAGVKTTQIRCVPEERTHWNAPPGMITLALETSLDPRDRTYGCLSDTACEQYRQV